MEFLSAGGRPSARLQAAIYFPRKGNAGCQRMTTCLEGEGMPELRLTELVQRVDQDKLVIPEFQRGFKWQTPDIRKLLESLLLDFPIGAALFWRTQRATLEFRRIEDVQFSDDDNGDETVSETHEGLKAEEI